MAQTLHLPGPAQGRISQILPSVKCSTCGEPVPIADLGDHVCASPSIPAANTKPPMSPTSPSFFQQKYQNLISSRPSTPKIAPVSPLVVKPLTQLSTSTQPATSPLSVQRGSLASTSSRTPSPGPRVQSPLVPPPQPPQPPTTTAPLNITSRTSTSTTRAKTPDSSKIAFPTTTSEPSPRIPSPFRHHPSEPTPVLSVPPVGGRTSSEPAPFVGYESKQGFGGRGAESKHQQQQAEVNPKLNGRQPTPNTDIQPLTLRPRAPSSTTPTTPSNLGNNTLSHQHVQQRPRAATDISGGGGSDVIYSTPSPALHLNVNTRYAPPPPPPSSFQPPPQTPSQPSSHHQPPPPSSHHQPPPPPSSSSHPHPHTPNTPGPTSPSEDIDTKTGGMAGMAGVGRRGFAAAARAAMFTGFGAGVGGGGAGVGGGIGGGGGMDGRRGNVPHFLDISSANQYASNTPPLSPGSTPSPHTPYSQQSSPLSSQLPPSSAPYQTQTQAQAQIPRKRVTPTHLTILTRTPSPLDPSSGGVLKERIVPVASDPPRMPLPATPSTPSMPFFERFKSRVPTAADADIPPQSPQKELGKEKVAERDTESDEESEFEGLAYADSDSDDGDGDEDTQKKDGREGRILAVSPTSPMEERVRFPSVSSVATLSDMKTESRYSRETVQPLRVRSSSSSTSTSTSSGSGSRKSGSSAMEKSLGGSLSGVGGSGEKRTSQSQSRKEKRQTIRMTGRGLDLAMATLLEEEGSVSGDVGGRGRGSISGGGRGSVGARGSLGGRGSVAGIVPPLPSVRGPSTSESTFIVNSSGGERERDSMRPKLPTRAKTTPSTSNSNTSASSSSSNNTAGESGGATTKRRATDASSRRKGGMHTCLKCGGWIEDGRWIRMEGAGVMCDRCWKGMYLPKCRRCSLVIEKQAVSSSDGQLKGKYHRDCFNCHTCHKPFPDKEFYVFDGKPFCKYHYHSENNSLCAATLCGQPIEGPCAVSHNGDRYHPEHLTCEYGRCAERLVDYWEVDGRMFCERHAQGVVGGGGDGEEEDGVAADVRATKRRTRFIDLAGMGQNS